MTTSDINIAIARLEDDSRLKIVNMRRNQTRGLGFLALVAGLILGVPPPAAVAVPAPEVEYTYDVMVRRHFDFPNNDALGYGFGICAKVTQGTSYADIMGQVKDDIRPNDETSANYVVSYAVGILCPAQIAQLRATAGGYRPPS